MKNTFKVGDKIICINSDKCLKIKLNEKYTISNVRQYKYNNDDVISLKEVDEVYSGWRFKIDITTIRKYKLKKIHEKYT